MPESVIVSVVCGSREQDLLIPLQVPIGQWLTPLARSMGGHKAVVSARGSQLDPSRTLADYSLWDGSVLSLELS